MITWREVDPKDTKCRRKWEGEAIVPVQISIFMAYAPDGFTAIYYWLVGQNMKEDDNHGGCLSLSEAKAAAESQYIRLINSQHAALSQYVDTEYKHAPRKFHAEYLELDESKPVND